MQYQARMLSHPLVDTQDEQVWVQDHGLALEATTNGLLALLVAVVRVCGAAGRAREHLHAPLVQGGAARTGLRSARDVLQCQPRRQWTRSAAYAALYTVRSIGSEAQGK